MKRKLIPTTLHRRNQQKGIEKKLDDKPSLHSSVGVTKIHQKTKPEGITKE